jgi:hypothetical protein
MTRVTPRFENPCTRSPPAFQTSPCPSARFRAYVIEIIPSSHSE